MRFPFFLCLLGAFLGVAHGQTPVINEFLAINDEGLADDDGRFPDWIEIHNPGDTAVDLQGYVLADSEGEWAFPESIVLGPDAYLTVMASGRDAAMGYQDSAGHWHTDFRLGRVDDSLTLSSPDGTVLSQIDAWPRQRTNVSYGVTSDGEYGYFEIPTPGEANGRSIQGFVSDTKFSVDRGYHTEAFDLVIEVNAPEDATILYTTDGTDPDEGTIFTGPIGQTYEGPIRIERTTVVKAVAIKRGWRSSNIDAQTYLFLDDVLTQSETPPEGYPDEWGGNPADYGMDPDVVNDPEYTDAFDEAFAVFPTLSLSLDADAMFERRRGIYQNTTAEGFEWERAVSAEFIFREGVSESFQVQCGIRIQGGSSRQTDIPKHSFSLRFRERYGLGKLDFPLFREAPFGRDALTSFDYLQLRSGFNFAWTHRHYYQSRHAQYNRDQFVNDLYLSMGHPGVHGRWFHLYINGLYWGMYHMHERPDANYMAGLFGGEKDDYDAVNSGQATDGNLQSWNALWALARQAEDPDVYAEIETKLDVDSFIDYLLINYFVGNWDWDGHNWRAAGPHGVESSGKWRFFPWDSEFAISPNGAGAINSPAPIENALTIDRTGAGGGNNRPTGLHQQLLDSAAYKLRLSDRVQKHFHHGGMLTTAKLRELWRARSDLMDVAIVAESARWGDYKRDVFPGRWPRENYDLYTKNEHYLPNQQFVLGRYLEERPGIALEQLRNRGWASRSSAPAFEVDGVAQHGGSLTVGQAIQLQGGGNVFYTIDGVTDPQDESAIAYDRDAGIVLDRSALVRVRGRTIFGQWSPLTEAFFTVGKAASVGDIALTELHYRPAAPSASEQAAGFSRRSDFEFIELRNISDERINLIGARFLEGVSFQMEDDLELALGETAVLVADAEAFALRYPGVPIAGVFQGKLSDGGETLTLALPSGEVALSFTYDDQDPWPTAADGEGVSLVSSTPDVITDDAAAWQASSQAGGSPGTVDEMPPSALSYEDWLATVMTPEQIATASIFCANSRSRQ